MKKPVEVRSDRVELVETFLRIVEAGSLSSAAKRLGTTQPTISRRLQMLESWLGIKLLRRSTHTMNLTGDGERFFARAKDVMEGWKSLEEEVQGSRAVPTGHLRVVVPHAFGQQQMIAPLTDFMRTYPNVTVEWILHDMRPNFMTDGIDCAIQLGPADDLNTVALHLAEVPRIVVAPPALVGKKTPLLTINDLHTIPWVALRQYYRDEVFLIHKQSAEERCIPIQAKLFSDSIYAVRAATLAGLGASLVSAWVVADDLAQGRLVQLVPEWGAASLPVYIVYPYARFYPARLRSFVKLMRNRMPRVVEMRVPAGVRGDSNRIIT
jgi:DNA-binding transcriptional LysR family regulator